MEEKSLDLLVQVHERLGGLHSDVRSLHTKMDDLKLRQVEHERDDEVVHQRVASLEQARFKLTVFKAAAVSAFGVGWTLLVWAVSVFVR